LHIVFFLKFPLEGHWVLAHAQKKKGEERVDLKFYGILLSPFFHFNYDGVRFLL